MEIQRLNDRRTQPAHRAGQAGFTLLEVLVVMALVALLFGIAINSMAPQRGRIDLNTAAQQLSQDLLTARARAMSTSNVYRILVKTTSSYSLQRSTDGGTTWTDQMVRTLRAPIVLSVGVANDKVTCDTRGFCLPSITGQVAGQTSEFRVTANGTTMRVVFAMVGTTRVVKL